MPRFKNHCRLREVWKNLVVAANRLWCLFSITLWAHLLFKKVYFHFFLPNLILQGVISKEILNHSSENTKFVSSTGCSEGLGNRAVCKHGGLNILWKDKAKQKVIESLLMFVVKPFPKQWKQTFSLWLFCQKTWFITWEVSFFVKMSSIENRQRSCAKEGKSCVLEDVSILWYNSVPAPKAPKKQQKKHLNH